MGGVLGFCFFSSPHVWDFVFGGVARRMRHPVIVTVVIVTVAIVTVIIATVVRVTVVIATVLKVIVVTVVSDSSDSSK